MKEEPVKEESIKLAEKTARMIVAVHDEMLQLLYRDEFAFGAAYGVLDRVLRKLELEHALKRKAEAGLN